PFQLDIEKRLYEELPGATEEFHGGCSILAGVSPLNGRQFYKEHYASTCTTTRRLKMTPSNDDFDVSFEGASMMRLQPHSLHVSHAVLVDSPCTASLGAAFASRD
ncbi:hypothetical protein Bbelb_446720, partial [Branchiostoma belcheri]